MIAPSFYRLWAALMQWYPYSYQKEKKKKWLAYKIRWFQPVAYIISLSIRHLRSIPCSLCQYSIGINLSYLFLFFIGFPILLMSHQKDFNNERSLYSRAFSLIKWEVLMDPNLVRIIQTLHTFIPIFSHLFFVADCE